MSENLIEQKHLFGLAYVLACKFLEKHLPGDSAYWSNRFISQAVEMLHDPNLSPEQMEKLCNEVFFGEKLN